MPLWINELSRKAFGEIATLDQYKAVVVITLVGGNDSNNMVIPLGDDYYRQYASLRTNVALDKSSLLPLSGTANSGFGMVGLHPSLPNIARRFNQRQALIVANVGPLVKNFTKTELRTNTSLLPESLLSHPAGAAQWLSASTVTVPDTGWGGRIADILSSQSGKLPPVLSASGSSVFSVGQAVQGIAIQAQGENGNAVPTSLQDAVQYLADQDARSSNRLVSEAAHLRQSSIAQQSLLMEATQAGSNLRTNFSSSNFGACMRSIAQIINGRSVIGASRQLFYCAQGSYDNHQQLVASQASNLSDLDTNLGAFMDALDEMGLTNQVLVCTHSDFNRTMQSNSTFGTDHGWGSHHIVLGGISGGRILGRFPELELGGSDDLNTQGVWIPTTAVTQMAAGIGTWMGLDTSQVARVFPDLSNFSTGALQFS